MIGICFLHTVIDDHSRVAYVEARDDETKETAIAVLRNAVAWFADRGVTVQRVLSDNGSCYKSNLWRETCVDLGITPKKTRPYRPQTNAKIERFHRTLAEGWAFKKFYNSESTRLAALPAWIHEYKPPPAPLGHREAITHHPVDQPGWISQLAGPAPLAPLAMDERRTCSGPAATVLFVGCCADSGVALQRAITASGTGPRWR